MKVLAADYEGEVRNAMAPATGVTSPNSVIEQQHEVVT
jgi:hypothetical protein